MRKGGNTILAHTLSGREGICPSDSRNEPLTGTRHPVETIQVRGQNTDSSQRTY